MYYPAIGRRIALSLPKANGLGLLVRPIRQRRLISYATRLNTTPAAKVSSNLSLRTYATKTTSRGTKPKSSRRGTAKKTKAKSRKATKKTTAAKKKTVKRSKRPLTEEEMIRKRARELKVKALLDEPKRLPVTAWTVIAAETTRPGVQAVSSFIEASRRYKTLSTSERENYNMIANRNKETNGSNLKAWIESFSKEEIRTANRARKQLNNLSRKVRQRPANPHPMRLNIKASYQPIKDHRVSGKSQVTAYALFTQYRWKSGDFSGIAVGDAGKQIGSEWRNLSANEKKRYEDSAATQRREYASQFRGTS